MPFEGFTKDEVGKYAVRGQYGAGWMEGEKVPAYREEKNVDPKSTVDTFAAVKFYIDNWRWQDVPFYIRTGKRLHEKTTVINIQFRPAPSYAFPPEAAETWRANRLTISIQPGNGYPSAFSIQTSRTIHVIESGGYDFQL